MAADLIIIAAGILLLVTGNNVTTAYSMIADDLTNELGFSLGTFALILFITCLVSAVCSVVMIYFSVVIGQLFPSHRVTGSHRSVLHHIDSHTDHQCDTHGCVRLLPRI